MGPLDSVFWPMRTWIRAAIVVTFLIFPLSACYFSEQEIIGLDQAAAVDGLVGTYTGEDVLTGEPTNIQITSVPSSNDYRFKTTYVDGTIETGTLRTLPLRSKIHLVQVQEDELNGYNLLFYTFDRVNGYREVTHNASDEQVGALASQHNVAIDFDAEFGIDVKGNRESVLSFLLAHKSFEFE